MKITEGIGLAFSRPWQFFKESFFGGKELVPIEEDPVGEFLDKNKGSMVLGEEEENEAPPTTGETAQAVAVVAVNKARDEKVEAVATSEVGNEQKLNESGMAERKTEDSPVALAVEAKTEEPQSVNKASEGPVKTEDKPQVLEAVNQSTEPSGQPSAKKPEGGEDKDTESILDVFRSEQGEMDTLGPLSEELDDMSIYSLLEEGKKIVSKIRGGRSESS
ncbi:MAG TPA: hypothetical protein VMW64_05290 [Dehalococcoidia bacterium]|nr:hypothetical protein [Dehalococcoidia bacterium]